MAVVVVVLLVIVTVVVVVSGSIFANFRTVSPFQGPLPPIVVTEQEKTLNTFIPDGPRYNGLI